MQQIKKNRLSYHLGGTDNSQKESDMKIDIQDIVEPVLMMQLASDLETR